MPQMSPIMWTLQIAALTALLMITKTNLSSKKEAEKNTKGTMMTHKNPSWKW